MRDVSFDEQMALNIDQRRISKKVKILEMKAHEDKKKRMPKRVKTYIKQRAEELLHKYGLDEK